MQEERTEDILLMCEVSLKNNQEKPFWYLCKYSITSLQSLAQGIMGNAINGTAEMKFELFDERGDGEHIDIDSVDIQTIYLRHRRSLWNGII